MTRDPVTDHGIESITILTNHDEFMTIAFSSLSLCIDVQSGILAEALTVMERQSSNSSTVSLHFSAGQGMTLNSNAA